MHPPRRSPVARSGPAQDSLSLWVPEPYPLVFALTYVGLLFLSLGISIHSAGRVFLVTAVLAVAIGIGANMLMRDRAPGAMLAFVLILVLLFGTTPAALAGLAVALALLIVERLVSWRSPSRVPWGVITTVATAATAVVALTFVVTGIQGGGFARVLEALGSSREAIEPATLPAGPPEIYVVLLDGYARPDKLQQLFGFDDGSFTDALERRGFDVATRSRSNYMLTTQSLPSMLNMRHLRDLGVNGSTTSPESRPRIASLIAESEVVRRLRGLGYHLVTVPSGFEGVTLEGADRVIDMPQLNEYEFVMTRESAVGAALDVLAPRYFADDQRARIDASFDAIAPLAREKRTSPLFAFIHVPAPHGPIVFGPAGEKLAPPPPDAFFEDTADGLGLSRKAFGERYVGEVAYVNGRTLAAVDAILAVSPRPPVILILSDHGSGSGVDWDDLEGSDVDERTANLFAAYTPGQAGLYPDDSTLVNAFGTLLTAYFGVDVPRQPDEIYGWDDATMPLVVGAERQWVH